MANDTGLPPWLRQRGRRGCARRGWPARSASGCAGRLRGVGEVFVHRARDDVEIQPLGALRRVVHELRRGFPAGRSAAIPRPTGRCPCDLLIFCAVLVEEQLVGEALGRLAAEDAADAAGQADAVDQVLARHLVVDAERVPAHRPVGLPLQLAGAAVDRGLERLAGVGIAPDDGAGGGVAALHRHLHDDAGARVDRQDRGIGGAAVRARASAG